MGKLFGLAGLTNLYLSPLWMENACKLYVKSVSGLTKLAASPFNQLTSFLINNPTKDLLA